MAKKETTDAPLAPVQSVAAVEVKIETTLVEVPFVSIPLANTYDGDQCHRCDLGLLTSEQLRKLRAIRRALIFSDRRLNNGGEVKSMADAVRALIDSVQI